VDIPGGPPWWRKRDASGTGRPTRSSAVSLRTHRGAIVSLVDRASKLTPHARVKRKTAEAVGKEMVRLLRPLSARVGVITADNGKEFAGHALVSKEFGSKFHFARPYHSWERGRTRT